jgi:integrase
MEMATFYGTPFLIELWRRWQLVIGEYEMALFSEFHQKRSREPRESGQIPYSAVVSAFRAACAKAGLVNLTLHSCRKTAATEMAIEGYSVLEIKDILHHSNSKRSVIPPVP